METKKVRIVKGDGGGWSHQLFLDDVDISEFVESVVLRIGPASIPPKLEIKLSFRSCFIELPDELEAIVTAEKQDAEWNPARRQMEQKSVSPNPLNWNWQDRTRGEDES